MDVDFVLESEIYNTLPEIIKNVLDDEYYSREYTTDNIIFHKNQKNKNVHITHDNIPVVDYSLNDYQNVHGPCISYKNGNIEYIRNYVNGIQHGISQKYYENGKIMSEVTLYNGLLHGNKYSYHDNGELSIEETYHHNMLHGTSYIYDTMKNITSTTQYYKGKRNGFYIQYTYVHYSYPIIKTLEKFINDKKIEYNYRVENGKFINERSEKEAYDLGIMIEKNKSNDVVINTADEWINKVHDRGRILIHIREGHYKMIGL